MPTNNSSASSLAIEKLNPFSSSGIEQETLETNQMRQLNKGMTTIGHLMYWKNCTLLITTLVISILHILGSSESAKAGVDDDFANQKVIQLATPNGLRMNMYGNSNGVTVFGLQADGSNDQKFVVEWQPGYGFKLRKQGTNFYITSKDFPQKTLGLIEGWSKSPNNDKLATFIALSSGKSGAYNICFKYQPSQCLNLPNQKRLARFTTYLRNASDADQQFTSISASNSLNPKPNLYFQALSSWAASTWIKKVETDITLTIILIPKVPQQGFERHLVI